VAAIAAVITALAGSRGLDFANMPELPWSCGYRLGVLVMTGVSVVLSRKVKKSAWL
jgi:magnesium transporter